MHVSINPRYKIVMNISVSDTNCTNLVACVHYVDVAVVVSDRKKKDKKVAQIPQIYLF